MQGSLTKIDMLLAGYDSCMIEVRLDVLKSVLWDNDSQNLFDPALVGFVLSEVKSRATE